MLHNHVTYTLSKNDLRMVKSVPPGGNWKNIPFDIPSKRLEQIRESGGRTTLYGRLSFKKPSYTITTYFNRPGNGTYIHPVHDRVITAREAARFQSFTDDYIFQGSKGSYCKQIGNAVPPLFAYSIATKIRKGTKTKNLLDLFCGAGGLSLGFGWAGYNIVVANDNFNHACETYKFNHKKTLLIEGDITKKEIQDQVLKEARKRKVDIIVGGPPCQGFSHAGKRMIDDPRNFLYKEFLNIVKLIKPKVFVIENVEGIITSNEGRTYSELKSNFEELGYAVAGHKLQIVKFGIPQKRKRVIIIGTMSGNPEDLFPEPFILEEGAYINTQDAIGDLSCIKVSETNSPIGLNTKPTHLFQKFARGLITAQEYIKLLVKLPRKGGSD